jgi:hypothetical protein
MSTLESTPNTSTPVVEHPKMTVIGTGYLGATHAICMAILGFEVLGVDVDQKKIDQLSAGVVPFFEPGLPEKLAVAGMFTSSASVRLSRKALTPRTSRSLTQRSPPSRAGSHARLSWSENRQSRSVRPSV